MKKLLSFIVFISFITLYKNSNAQTLIPAGDVSGTWTKANSPYNINGEITIPNYSSLTIEPGAIVEFQGHYKLNVQGRLFAVGTQTDTISFTINDTTGFHDSNIPDGGWAGIRFSNVFSLIDSSSIIYCKIEYGKAIGSWPDNTGGAICVDGFDNLTIANCLITNNIASISDGSGGAIALWASNPIITGNTVSNNIAQVGGGISCYESSPQIESNIIEYNRAEQGGGLVCNENSNPTITNATIENNTAANGGGGIVCWGSSPSLDNVTFAYNSAINGLGAAVSFSCGGTLNNLYYLTITNTVFTHNTGGNGGGIWAGSMDSARVNVTVDKCTFTNNIAGVGSGLRFIGKHLDFTISNSIFSGNEATYIGAGSAFAYRCTGEVSNCLFASNNAGTTVNDNSGGVVIQSGANVVFMNCTFSDNAAFYGAGLTVGGGATATTTNCIFWGNSTDQIALDTLNSAGGTLAVNYCDVQDGENSVNVIDPALSVLNWGTENIDEDPIFENSGNDDYHLQNSSPCIGTAIDAIEINGIMCYCPNTDIEGNPRPNPAGSMPDMGAYESSEGTVGVDENLSHYPTEYSLYQNYPNPFNPVTTIKYQISHRSNVSLKIYDIIGNEVAELVNEEQEVGYYNAEFNAANLSSGVYFYQLKADSYVETKKMILLK